MPAPAGPGPRKRPRKWRTFAFLTAARFCADFFAAADFFVGAAALPAMPAKAPTSAQIATIAPILPRPGRFMRCSFGLGFRGRASTGGVRRIDARRMSCVREAHAHYRPTPLGVLGPRPAAVRLGRLAHDRQPQTGPRHRARMLRAEEAVEDMRQVFLVEAGAVVAHRQLAV